MFNQWLDDNMKHALLFSLKMNYLLLFPLQSGLLYWIRLQFRSRFWKEKLVLFAMKTPVHIHFKFKLVKVISRENWDWCSANGRLGFWLFWRLVGGLTVFEGVFFIVTSIQIKVCWVDLTWLLRQMRQNICCHFYYSFYNSLLNKLPIP